MRRVSAIGVEWEEPLWRGRIFSGGSAGGSGSDSRHRHRYRTGTGQAQATRVEAYLLGRQNGQGRLGGDGDVVVMSGFFLPLQGPSDSLDKTLVFTLWYFPSTQVKG